MQRGARARLERPSVSDVIRRAASICDPDGRDPAVTGLVERFEDDERPARGLEGTAWTIAAGEGEAPEGEAGPAAVMTKAAAAWLATNPEHADDHGRVLRESARATFGTRAPADVEAWLGERGVQL